MDTWVMKREPRTRPDRLVDSYREVTPDVLRDLGRSVLLLDVDSTLGPHGSSRPEPEVVEWAEVLRRHGIRCFVVSNGGHRRMAEFCVALEVPFIARAGKPSPAAVRKGLSILGAAPEDAAFLGDQLYTDIRCAGNAGVLSILTAPVSCHEPLNVRCKRWFERRTLRRILTRDERSHWSRPL